MDEKEFEEKQEQQGKTDSVQEEQAVESAQEEPVSAEDTTKDHEPEEEKTEDSMTDEEKEALEKAKAADHAKETSFGRLMENERLDYSDKNMWKPQQNQPITYTQPNNVVQMQQGQNYSQYSGSPYMGYVQG